jgi:hypothetical protein
MFTIEWRFRQLIGTEPDDKSLACKGRANNNNNNNNNNNMHNYYYMKIRLSNDI